MELSFTIYLLKGGEGRVSIKHCLKIENLILREIPQTIRSMVVKVIDLYTTNLGTNHDGIHTLNKVVLKLKDKLILIRESKKASGMRWHLKEKTGKILKCADCKEGRLSTERRA